MNFLGLQLNLIVQTALKKDRFSPQKHQNVPYLHFHATASVGTYQRGYIVV